LLFSLTEKKPAISALPRISRATKARRGKEEMADARDYKHVKPFK
jgi:hypothetical protein